MLFIRSLAQNYFMIELQYFDGSEWTTVSTWENERIAWITLGGDDYNYRTIDENGKVLTDKRTKNN